MTKAVGSLTLGLRARTHLPCGFDSRTPDAAHLRQWLRFYSASELFVVDPGVLLGGGQPGAGGGDGALASAGMRALAQWLGLPADASALRDAVVASPSPGAKQLGEAAGVHENARKYILGKLRGGSVPGAPEIARNLHDWLRPHQCDLAGLLLRRGLAYGEGGLLLLPWLSEELRSSAAWADAEGPGGGVCAGVVSVDEWFIAS